MTSAVPAGCSSLVSALDRCIAAGKGDQIAITKAVESTLCELIGGGEVHLPSALMKPAPNGYARRLIHHNPTLDYTAIAMVWAPGQGTPVHDHDGLWCVEGVLTGKIVITQYDLEARDDVRYRFERQPSMDAEVGSAGRLIPPYDYHTIANRAEQDAVTIHVYGGEMNQCSAFLELEDGWYQREVRPLRYSAA